MTPLGWRMLRSRRSCCLQEAACTSEPMSQGLFVSSYRLVLKSRPCCLLPQEEEIGPPSRSLSKQVFPDAAGSSHRLGGVGSASHQQAHREGRPDSIATALFNSGDDENFLMSDPELEAEQEGSSGSPITMAEVCMAGTPPPQASTDRKRHRLH